MDDVKESAANAVDLSGQGLDALSPPDDTDHLDMSGNNFEVLPDSLAALAGLTGLEAYSNQLGKTFKTKAAAISVLAKLPKLKAVNLYNNKLGKLTTELAGLTDMEEFNISGNKLMQIQDGAFQSWTACKVLNLYSNNLVMIGATCLAPLVALEELRLYENQLSEAPVLGDSHPALTIFEIHKNNIKEIKDDYFAPTPALERVSLWGQGAKLTNLPSSLVNCKALKGVQAQENDIASVPDGPWPETLETFFIQDNPSLAKVPSSLAKCPKLTRVNIGGLGCKDDSEMQKLEDLMKAIVVSQKDDGGRSSGIIWGLSGQKLT